MNSKNSILIPIVLVFMFFSCEKKEVKLPIISNLLAANEKLIDYPLKNQFNENFSLNNLKGKVHLVNFFFVSCRTICPAMESNLKEIVLKNPDIELLSFTIDPEKDIISVLKSHHQNMAKNSENWTYLRSTKKDLKKIANLYLSTIKNIGDNNDNFYHTSSVVLIDKSMRIRGFYDSLIDKEMKLLKRDIKLLLKE